MASPIHVIDIDDDDFDWDAAVKEIDVVCRSTAAEPPQTPPPPPPPPPPLELKKNRRQSTLDKFVTNVGSSKPFLDIPVNDVRVSDNGRAGFVEIDLEAAKTWVYPDNVPRREYQLAIAKTALFSNTLVALPTGLGKTLIAAVVMYNYFRWFPEGKIVFSAPSRPLVMQQIEACLNVVGIPQEWTIDMTGLTSPPKRASLWKSKRVFFVTPQVLEKDIQSGACLVKYLVCLVIDEAHRAMGNYSYCVAVRELMAVPVDLRILALTATPGSKQETIQQVIDNLRMSTLEYRSENDHDVCPYVHNRKIELIEVPMGNDATEINNLFVEVIRPIAARLSTMGVLPRRDFQTLSPCDLLNSRDKFRQAPPPELCHMKYGEVEGYFGVLITLYHIRKLLSSHGIRPAHEMLQEKLKQGYFTRYMSRNEAIQRANHLMQHSLSHGAPSPKLSKMIEVLLDHFKTNDPQNSRVIIFSNFRGSVRDILDSVAKIGNSVKATQFIGQSSGKTLKGQSQKAQQAVLEKFRTGGYNVIVATSIGEEGLDIMEVDLVICFDANISPLRMIQRMGRTGRKHDGRVVVLACEGTELKGYMRKQATGKTVRKHMQNGGMNSFNFHPSPRMVPHLLKPELLFEELSIQKFVRQAKKVQTDSAEAPMFWEKLTGVEAGLLDKYFSPTESIYKPSLIAFPHFQAFPSRVRRVMHSSRTGWLIDVMQHLQGSSFPGTSRTCGIDSSWSRFLATGSFEQLGESGRDFIEPVNLTYAQKGTISAEVSPSSASVSEKRLFDSPGRVLESGVSDSSISSSKKQHVPGSSNQNGREPQSPPDAEMLEAAAGAVVCTPPSDHKYMNKSIGIKTADTVSPEPPEISARKCDFVIVDSDLSPRLTNFINSGFVPESPLSTPGSQSEGKNEILFPELRPISPPRSCRNSLQFADEKVITDSPLRRDAKGSPVPDEAHTPLRTSDDGPSEMGDTIGSPSAQEFRTPLRNLTNTSCSKDWQISSGEKSAVQRSGRFRRLRKIGELDKKRSEYMVKEKSICYGKPALKFSRTLSDASTRKVRRPFEDVRDFIDEEAEVSSEDVVPDSEDEGNHEDSDAYEDSFIDDGVEPTANTTQAADSKVDMMAIYRRSLFTQSPFQGQQNHATSHSPLSMASIATTESEDCSGKTCTLQTPQGHVNSPNLSAGRKSVRSCLNSGKIILDTMPSMSGRSQVNEADMDSPKRRMGSNGDGTLPAKNLEREFGFHSSPSAKELPHCQTNGIDASFAAFFDDQFYEGIDLDELEAQAAKLLSQKTGFSVQGRRLTEPTPQNITVLGPPSFDLGIS